MWPYIIDGALILIIVIFAIIGIAKGLFDSLLSLISTSLALAISIFTAKYVANFINKIFNFESLITNKLTEVAGDSTMSLFGGKVHLSCEELSKFTVWIISVIIIFIIIKIVVLILAKIFEAVTNSSPTISGINRVLGMVFGIVKGCVWVLMLLALCSVVSGMPKIGEPIYNTINNTKITGPIFKYVDDFVGEKLTQDKIKDIVDRIVSLGKDKTEEETLTESEQAVVGEYSITSITNDSFELTKTNYVSVLDDLIAELGEDEASEIREMYNDIFTTYTISINADKTATFTISSDSTNNSTWTLEGSTLTLKKNDTEDTITFTVSTNQLSTIITDEDGTTTMVFSKNA